jgi:ABC-type amino acid transport substrate-binding protein
MNTDKTYSSLFFISFIFIYVFLSPLIIFSQHSEGSEAAYKLFINLTEDEKKWIEEHQSIRISGPKSFPPFHSYDEKGTPTGIAADYIEILCENLGIDLIIQANLPWPDVLNRSRDKELDVIACSAKSADREKYLLFTNPQLSFPLVIISRDDSPFIADLNDLTHMKVALLNKNIITDWLERDRIDVTPYPADSPLDALRSVSSGAAEAYIGNLATCTYLINKYGLVNLKVAAPTEYGNYDLFIAVRDDWPELVSILNKSLDAVSPEQHIALRNNWLSIKYDFGISPGDIIKTILIVTGIAAVILLIILRWNRLLRKEIKTRKKTEKELMTAFEDIKTLTGLLPICAHCKNIRDDKGYWKKIEGYFEDHTNISFSHSLCPECADELYSKEDWYPEEKKTVDKNTKK